MKNINIFFHKFRDIKSKQYSYFADNLVSYTYLFFAQATIIAMNDVWSYELKTPFGRVLFYSFRGMFNLTEVFISYIVPLFFIYISAITFKYPKDSKYKVPMICFNVALYMFVIFSSFLPKK